MIRFEFRWFVLCCMFGLVFPNLSSAQQEVGASALNAKPKSFYQLLPLSCGSGYWRLTNAEVTLDDDGDASFRDEWVPLLDEVKACLDERDLQSSCVLVRGHYDSIEFETSIARAFGSKEAAQKTRARGRAISVTTRLHALGVSAERLRELPPLSEETFRGAEVTLVRDCLPEQKEVTETPLEPNCETVDVEVLAQRAAGEAMAQFQASQAKSLVTIESPHELWLQPSVTLSFSHAHTQANIASLFGVGVGWTNQLVYLRALVRLGLGARKTYRVPFEAVGGAGLHVLEWLDVGVSGGYQLTSRNIYDPWFQRAWFIGGEASECLWSWVEGSEFCLYQALYPIAGQEQRVQWVEGEAFQASPSTSYLFRMDAGVSMRFNML